MKRFALSGRTLAIAAVVIALAALAGVCEDHARALSDLQALRAQRVSLRLVAPADGIVTAREVEPGTAVMAGQAVVEVVDPRTLWVNTRFDQVSAAGLAAGLPARVTLRSRRGQALDGKVLRTELRADAVTEEMLAKVGFNTVPEPLPPIGEGTEVMVDLPPLPDGPVIPNAAVQRQGAQVGAQRLADSVALAAAMAGQPVLPQPSTAQAASLRPTQE